MYTFNNFGEKVSPVIPLFVCVLGPQLFKRALACRFRIKTRTIVLDAATTTMFRKSVFFVELDVFFRKQRDGGTGVGGWGGEDAK